MKKKLNSIKIVSRFCTIYCKKSLLSYYVSITDKFEGFRAKLSPEARELLSLAQQSNSGLGRSVVEVSRTHTSTNSVGLLCMSDQLVAEAATYPKSKRHESPYPERESNSRSQQ